MKHKREDGAEQYVHIVAAGGSLIARVPRTRSVKVDETVTVAAEMSSVHLFDQNTGLAMR